jgi:hypothetical protein
MRRFRRVCGLVQGSPVEYRDPDNSIVQAISQGGDRRMRKAIAIVALAGSILLGLEQPTAAQDMFTVGELLKDCRTNSTLCNQDFSYNSISMAFLWGGNCVPAKLVRQQKEIAVLRWLSKHQEIAQEDAPDGVADAVSALWPCASQ